MAVVRAAIRLKSSDPVAGTALRALSRAMPDSCPEALSRYDLWEFDLPGGREEVLAILARFPDILNPNKQECFFPEEGLLPGESPSLTWVSVEVSERSGSTGSTWSQVIGRAGFELRGLRLLTLWRLGYPSAVGSARALEAAGETAVSVSRNRGLLSNPVSQSAEVSAALSGARSL
jgi:hypothetical protein